MKNVLSIFIDESGDFGFLKEKPAYYLVTMIFHSQKNDITTQITKLENSIAADGFDVEYIHTGPIIRREEIFDIYSLDERRKLIYKKIVFDKSTPCPPILGAKRCSCYTQIAHTASNFLYNKILNFFNSCPVTCLTVKVNRKEAPDKVSLSGRLAKEIQKLTDAHKYFFDSFDNIIVYYDNGQAELSAVLNAVFSICFNNVEFRKAEPQRYRLLQVADFVCSFELLRIKRDENRLSKSEEKFFYKPQELKKTFIKSIDKKILK